MRALESLHENLHLRRFSPLLDRRLNSLGGLAGEASLHRSEKGFSALTKRRRSRERERIILGFCNSNFLLLFMHTVSIKYTGIASSYSCKKLYKYTHYRKQGRLPKEIELILIIICRLNVIWNE